MQRIITHDKHHIDIEETRTDEDGNLVWAVVYCSYADEMAQASKTNQSDKDNARRDIPAVSESLGQKEETMNGYTPAIPLKERVNNLIVQIPQEYRNRAAAECLTGDGNPNDFERNLTGYVMRREWEFYDHPVNEAEFVDGFCDERLTLKMNSLTIDFSGAVENASRRSAELKAKIDARRQAAKERNKGQFAPR